ncbi:hypothetical protein TNCV_3639801 [Trichonephila clavipes]|nr:hypothetical protein TNCV_3639801 [Trichonephila clavipes]
MVAKQQQQHLHQLEVETLVKFGKLRSTTVQSHYSFSRKAPVCRVGLCLGLLDWSQAYVSASGFRLYKYVTVTKKTYFKIEVRGTVPILWEKFREYEDSTINFSSVRSTCIVTSSHCEMVPAVLRALRTFDRWGKGKNGERISEDLVSGRHYSQQSQTLLRTWNAHSITHHQLDYCKLCLR